MLTRLRSSVQYSFTEQKRGDARKKWIQEIINAGKLPSAATDPSAVFAKVFEVLLEDNKTFGEGDVKLSANITKASGNGTDIQKLTIVATTPEDEAAALGQSMLWTDSNCASFSAVTKAKPVHVVSVLNHGRVRCFKPRVLSEVTGACFVLTLPVSVSDVLCLRRPQTALLSSCR